MSGRGTSQVAPLCQGLKGVTRVKQRPLESTYPSVWPDAKYFRVRAGDCVVSRASVVATGVAPSGDREILGVDIGLGEDAAFLRGRVARDLRGVHLVISDAHIARQRVIPRRLPGG